jgi:hypothetical protein
MRSSAFPAEDKSTVALPIDIMPAYVDLMSDDSLSVNGDTLNAQ